MTDPKQAKKPGTKLTRAEIEARDDFLTERIGRCCGWTSSIEREAAEAWGVSRRAVRRYHGHYLGRLAEQAARADYVERRRADLVQRTEAAIRMATEQGRPDRVLKGLELLAKLEGVAAPQRHEVAVKGALTSLSDEQLAALITDLQGQG